MTRKIELRSYVTLGRGEESGKGKKEGEGEDGKKIKEERDKIATGR